LKSNKAPTPVFSIQTKALGTVLLLTEASIAITLSILPSQLSTDAARLESFAQVRAVLTQIDDFTLQTCNKRIAERRCGRDSLWLSN
jgi:hypothetical protein